jgi:ribosomal protein L11
MMTKKEQVAFRKLELENENLKRQLEKAGDIYRDQLYEIVQMKTKLMSINQIASMLYDEAAL